MTHFLKFCNIKIYQYLNSHKDDLKQIKEVLLKLKELGVDYRMLILPDHPTPLCLRTHTRDAVPYLIYDSTEDNESNISSFDEHTATKSGIMVEQGYKLMERFIKK